MSASVLSPRVQLVAQLLAGRGIELATLSPERKLEIMADVFVVADEILEMDEELPDPKEAS